MTPSPTPNQQLSLQDLDVEQNVLDNVSDFFRLYTCGTNANGNPLVGSIRQRVHIHELSCGRRENDNGGWAYVG